MEGDARPRCRICGRRLRSIPWKDLGIGPVCARRYRDEPIYRERFMEKRLEPRFSEQRLLEAEIAVLDDMIRKAQPYLT